MFNEFKKRIKKDKPFQNLINIKAIEEIGEDFDYKLSRYGEAVARIKDTSGRFYKLRMVGSIKKAKRKERMMRLVPHILPKFYGRDRNYLLFEFLQGRILTENESSDILFQLGKMCGEVSKFKADATEESKRKFAKSYYKMLKYFFDKELIKFKDYRNMLKTYKMLLKKVEFEVVLCVQDMYSFNFLVVPQKKVYLVDELALRYSIQGYEFNKVSQRYSKEQQKSFLKGYNSVNSIKFLTPSYKKLIIFLTSLDGFSHRFARIKNKINDLIKLSSTF